MNNIFDLLPSANCVASESSVSETPGGDKLLEVLEQFKLQAEHAQSMAHHSPSIFLKAAMNIAAMDVFTVLNRFDSVTLAKRLEEKPELCFQLINWQANLMRAHLDQQKFEFKQKQAETKQRERDQKLRARKPILITETTLRAFARAVGRSTPAEPRNSSAPELPPVASPSVSAPDKQPLAENAERSFTADRSRTETVDVTPAELTQLTRDNELSKPSPLTESSWFDAPTEDLVCCPS